MSGENFNQLMESVHGNDGMFQARIATSWVQGRAAYGGLVAALAVEAMRQAPEVSNPLRAIQVLFASPAAAGSVTINTQVIRQGRSVTTMRADLIQEGQICCTVMASFGAARSSKIHINANPMPEAVAPESLQSLPFISGLMPDFLQHFELRQAKGSPPFTNCQDTRHGIWARFRDQGNATITHLIGIADIPAPIPLSMLTEPANGSSLTWALQFLGDDWEASTDDWWYIETLLDQCSEGYAQQRYKIWAPGGQPVALAQQVMTVFA